jgi:hypothetical protein
MCKPGGSFSLPQSAYRRRTSGFTSFAISSPNPDASSADSEHHDEQSLPSLVGDWQDMHASQVWRATSGENRARVESSNDSIASASHPVTRVRSHSKLALSARSSRSPVTAMERDAYPAVCSTVERLQREPWQVPS